MERRERPVVDFSAREERVRQHIATLSGEKQACRQWVLKILDRKDAGEDVPDYAYEMALRSVDI